MRQHGRGCRRSGRLRRARNQRAGQRGEQKAFHGVSPVSGGIESVWVSFPSITGSDDARRGIRRGSSQGRDLNRHTRRRARKQASGVAPALLFAALARRRRGCAFHARHRVEEDDAPVALHLALARAAGSDAQRRNKRSGAIVLVRPLGAPGTRLTATRTRLLRRRGGRRDGRQTMPAGGGPANLTRFAVSIWPCGVSGEPRSAFDRGAHALQLAGSA
ncbi:MAG: hypothetical protein ACK5X1_16440 [Betaproteobacteria bacterium]